MIRLDSNSAAPYLSRAAAYYEKGKEARSEDDEKNFFTYLDLAINDYDTALQIEPGDVLVREALEHLTRERELRKEVYNGRI
jgi:hypothetical protein